MTYASYCQIRWSLAGRLDLCLDKGWISGVAWLRLVVPRPNNRALTTEIIIIIITAITPWGWRTTYLKPPTGEFGL